MPRNLLYLVGQSVLELPPLRMRDREAVLDNVIAHDIEDPIEVTNSAKDVLINYDWPGNTREMRAVVREALICGNGRRINVTDLPDRLSVSSVQPETAVTRAALRDALDSTNWNVTKAARLLGKSRATINRWIASESLQRHEYDTKKNGWARRPDRVQGEPLLRCSERSFPVRCTPPDGLPMPQSSV